MVHGRTDLIKTSHGRLSDERCPLGKWYVKGSLLSKFKFYTYKIENRLNFVLDILEVSDKLSPNLPITYEVGVKYFQKWHLTIPRTGTGKAVSKVIFSIFQAKSHLNAILKPFYFKHWKYIKLNEKVSFYIWQKWKTDVFVSVPVTQGKSVICCR